MPKVAKNITLEFVYTELSKKIEKTNKKLGKLAKNTKDNTTLLTQSQMTLNYLYGKQENTDQKLNSINLSMLAISGLQSSNRLAVDIMEAKVANHDERITVLEEKS